jgi:hypothetical protein
LWFVVENESEQLFFYNSAKLLVFNLKLLKASATA